ncbi:MAG: hypothetical protein LBT46_12285 [Planctomycetaceae bacterium]|nr:hypothetical protein [Planctomycetaceae bacterium]
MQPVIGIAITAYDSLKHLPEAHHSFYFRSKYASAGYFTDGIRMHVLEITARKAGQFGRLKPRLRYVG